MIKLNIKHINPTRVKQLGCNSERIEREKSPAPIAPITPEKDATQKELKVRSLGLVYAGNFRFDATQKELKGTGLKLTIEDSGKPADATQKELKVLSHQAVYSS